MVRIPDFPDTWRVALSPHLPPNFWPELAQTASHCYLEQEVFPPADALWRAFDCCPPERVAVVVLGQDPYHGPGQANGLAFSVPLGIPLPPSLRNIYKEFHSDTGCTPPSHGDLSAWASQGVLLLNTCLTVRAGMPGSHADGRWDAFVGGILSYLNSIDRPVVFWLWGAHAQKRGVILTNPRHLVLRSAHPSPLGAYRGFWGSRPFSRTSEWFKSQGITGPDWSACLPTFGS